MTTDQHAPTKPEPDYDPDEAMVLLTEIQMRALGKIRQTGLDLLDDVNARGGDATKLVTGKLDRAYERISKALLQVMAMEQHTIKLRADTRATLKIERAKKKKAEVTREVEAVLDAVAKAPAAKVTPEAARIAALPRMHQLNLLKNILFTYDFSDSRTAAVLVAEICAKLGIDFAVAEWPAEGAEAEVAVKPSPPVTGFEPGSAAGVGLMAQAASAAKVREPP